MDDETVAVIALVLGHMERRYQSGGRIARVRNRIERLEQLLQMSMRIVTRQIANEIGCRNNRNGSRQESLTESLIRPKDKMLILNNRAACHRAELIQLKRQLVSVKIILRIEHIVAKEFPNRAV